MRIVFSSRPAFGHVFAIAPLATAARDAGHDVIFASGENFLPRLKKWGFETRALGEGIEWAFQRAAAQYPELLEPERPEFGARLFVDVLGPASLSDMRAVIEETAPDLVVYEATDLGSAVAASAAGIPIACHALSLWITEFIDAMRGRTHVLWEAAGLSPGVDVTVGDALLDIWPPSMQSDRVADEARRHWLLRPITWSDPSADVPSWIGSIAGPLVFVSLGTVFWGKELLVKVIDGLAKLDCDALVLAGVDATPDDLPTDNERLKVTGFVNQAEVLRYADVVIHHGGAGTLLGSLARGLPALVLPEGADRPYTAKSLGESGAGIVLEPRSATSEDIAEAVTTLLNDDLYRDRARAIKDEIEAMPAPAKLVEQLESLTA